MEVRGKIDEEREEEGRGRVFLLSSEY